MMVEARKDDDKRPVADAAADLSRLAESSTRLFAEQAAALAVMTAYGMSVAAQMTGMMLGSLRGPVDASDLAASEAKPAPVEPEANTSPNVVPLRPAAAHTTAAVPVPSAVAAKPHRAAGTVKAKASLAKPAATKPARRTTPASAVTAKAAAGGDDLKKISGIGPRLEQVLNERGVRSYADLASMSKAALKKLDAELGLEGRVVRDDWASKARALSGGKG
jgi:NADH-quinone oxidoreductase subunit E